MDLQLISVQEFRDFIVVTARVAGFVIGIPIILSTQSPVRFRVLLIFMVSLALFPVLRPYAANYPYSAGSYLVLVVNEVLLGAIIGLIGRFIFTSVEFGGTVIGYQMGFAAANIYDPQNQRQTALISQFQNVFAILIFLTLNVHHYYIRLAARSYEILPPGRCNLSDGAVPYLIELSTHMFVLGVQFSIPVLALLLLSGLILGVLSRSFPQLNVFMLSFPLNIFISFSVMALTLGIAKILLSREFDTLPERVLTLLHTLQ